MEKENLKTQKQSIYQNIVINSTLIRIFYITTIPTDHRQNITELLIAYILKIWNIHQIIKP